MRYLPAQRAAFVIRNRLSGLFFSGFFTPYENLFFAATPDRLLAGLQTEFSSRARGAFTYEAQVAQTNEEGAPILVHRA